MDISLPNIHEKLVLSYSPTHGRNVCIKCNSDNLSRVGSKCTTCGHGFDKDTFIKCIRCDWGYGLPFVRCPHCTPIGDFTKLYTVSFTQIYN
jgi:hypothetical protein